MREIDREFSEDFVSKNGRLLQKLQELIDSVAGQDMCECELDVQEVMNGHE